MRAAIYLRVSTDEQTTDNQERELQAAAERSATRSSRSTEMRASRGRRARISALSLTRCTRTRPDDVDVVMAWSIDRLGRSSQDLWRAGDCGSRLWCRFRTLPGRARQLQPRLLCLLQPVIR
jgi:DNA invertase Pin-like site-specific DNA recombinase